MSDLEFDPFLRDVLACPACLSERLDVAADERIPRFLLCARCASVYPIEHGTPNFVDLRSLLRLPVELLAVWHLTQQRAAPLYASRDVGSCSLRERDDVQAFQRFMSLSGRSVLDVGSGSFALPGYVADSDYYADSRGYTHYVGVDPIPPDGEPSFPLVVAMGELLPFRDGTFGTAIFATSLDHALDVDRTLAETWRILQPHGEIYFWGMFEAESRLGEPPRPLMPRVEPEQRPTDPVEAYLASRDAYQTAIHAIERDPQRFAEAFVDEYHFRHFDRSTLVEAIERARFVLVDEHAYTSAAGDQHVFLRLGKEQPERALVREASTQLGDAVRTHVAEIRHEIAAAQAKLAAVTDDVASLREAVVAASARVGPAERLARRLTPPRARRALRLGKSGLWSARVMAPQIVRAAAAKRGPARRPAQRRVLMLAISQIEYDPRINKVARTLANAGYEVEIMVHANGSDREYELVPGVRCVRVPRKTSLGRFLVYQDEYRRAALERGFDFVHANDLTTLTTAWVLAQKRNVPLIYDAHELWTENVELRGASFVPMSRSTRLAAGRWEQFLLRYVDVLVTVGPSIVAHYAALDGLKRPPVLLPNYPSLSLLDDTEPRPSIRELCGLDDDHFVTLYLGGVNPLRNIEAVIEAHRFLPERHVFVIRGPGADIYADEYGALARNVGVADRVFFIEPVQMHEILSGMDGADCGIVMLRNICKNFYWFYPNKLFDYALAALPVAVSEFPDVTEFVRSEQCGVTFDPDSPQSIADALRWLGENPAEAGEMGERGRMSILQRHHWEQAASSLVEAYGELGS